MTKPEFRRHAMHLAELFASLAIVPEGVPWHIIDANLQALRTMLNALIADDAVEYKKACLASANFMSEWDSDSDLELDEGARPVKS